MVLLTILAHLGLGEVKMSGYSDDREYCCNHCGILSRGRNIILYAKTQMVANTTCPQCGQPSAFAKVWLCEDGTLRPANPSIQIPRINIDGKLRPHYDSSSWPHHFDGKKHYTLVIHPRECAPINGR